MNPADYGISVYSPEATVTIGAEELIYKVGKMLFMQKVKSQKIICLCFHYTQLFMC